MRALFSGRRDLFKGLWIEQSDWDWTVYPVIRLDLSTVNNENPGLFERSLIKALNEIASEHKITLSGETPSDYLSDLIIQLTKVYKQRVVVLVDEYDRPLIDNLENTELAQKNRDILRRFYIILKALNEHIRFLFLTGVTNFSKVSVFSGLNNLINLSMRDEFSSLLGYTKEELNKYFSGSIEEVARRSHLSVESCYAQIKEWYNGYQFSENGELVYNPFSTLMLLDSKKFLGHWYETGTPTFLIKLIQQRELDLISLEQYEIRAENFNTFEIEELPLIPILYQTGYLTIKSYDPQFNTYHLGFPNREVGESFSSNILRHFAVSKTATSDYLSEIHRTLSTAKWDFSVFFDTLTNLLALLPYDLYLKNEKHYQSLFYLIIKLAGISVSAEVHTRRGRVDAVIEMKDKIIVFEFKLDKNASMAIEQMKQGAYYQIYNDRQLPIYLAGINFNSQLRTIDDWSVEQI